MSYQEKRVVVSIATGILILAAYCVYAFGQYQSGLVAAGDLKFWARTMLIFIGIGIVANIVIQIIFHILLSIGMAVEKKIKNEVFDDKDIEKSIDAQMIEDEMDKLIDLKSARTGFVVFGIGFVLGLVSILMDYPAAVMINILFIACSLGSILEGFTQLYFYRRGV